MNQEPTVEISEDIAAFLADLRQHYMAHKTVQAYTADMVGFARWFVDTTGIRVGELCSLRLMDLSISDRKGSPAGAERHGRQRPHDPPQPQCSPGPLGLFGNVPR